MMKGNPDSIREKTPFLAFRPTGNEKGEPIARLVVC